jgi:glycosyltransferase involved in cell wall biosynthesis
LKIPISIIVPIFNEEKRVEKGINRLLEVCDKENWDFEIIVVEDGCTDNSVNIVKKISLKDRRVRIISLVNRCGKGGSIIQAIRECKKENIGYLDIDMSADPSEFNRLFPYLQNNTLVIGSRILRGTLNPIQRPYYRTLLSKMYLLYFSTLFNAKIYDTQCGLKLFKKKDVLSVLSSINTTGFAFDTEFIIKMLVKGLVVKEVPINWIHVEDSKLKIHKAVFMMSKDLIKIWYDVLESHINDTIYYNQWIIRPKGLLRIIFKTRRSLLSLRTNVSLSMAESSQMVNRKIDK